jgi:hypothetical protein
MFNRGSAPEGEDVRVKNINCRADLTLVNKARDPASSVET